MQTATLDTPTTAEDLSLFMAAYENAVQRSKISSFDIHVIQNADGSAITLWQALLRFVVAIGSWLFCGLGFLWVLWDKDKRSWHDIYSESRVVQLPKNIHKK